MTSVSYARWAAGMGAVALVACTRPPKDPPGVEEQPAWHAERNPATRPTAPREPNALPAAESPEDPDSPGTPRTPPAGSVQPMDDERDAAVPEAQRAR